MDGNSYRSFRVFYNRNPNKCKLLQKKVRIALEFIMRFQIIR